MKLNRVKSGQGLLEAVIAIGIIITGLVAVITLTTANIMTASEASSHLLANNLSREGIEAIRAIRDSSWLANPNQSWYTYVTSGTDVTAIPVLNPKTFAWALDFRVDDINEAKAVIWRDDNFIYRQAYQDLPAGSNKTRFFRLLNLYPICQAPAPSLNEISNQSTCQTGWTRIGVRVVSTVSYIESGKNHSLSLEDMLYNWRAN